MATLRCHDEEKVLATAIHSEKHGIQRHMHSLTGPSGD